MRGTLARNWGQEDPDIYWWVENDLFLLVYTIWVYRREKKSMKKMVSTWLVWTPK